MTVQEIKDLLDARLLSGAQFLDKEVHSACGSDMMSDVLAFVKDQSVLITGLCNPQVIRTAEMMDIVCLVFVRGKVPDDNMINLASQRDIAVLSTELPCFPHAACYITPGCAEVLPLDDKIVLKYTVSPDDFTRAGEASSNVKAKLKQIGVPPEVVRKAAIAMYEGEINMVIHANGGEITVTISRKILPLFWRTQGRGFPMWKKLCRQDFPLLRIISGIWVLVPAWVFQHEKNIPTL